MKYGVKVFADTIGKTSGTIYELPQWEPGVWWITNKGFEAWCYNSIFADINKAYDRNSQISNLSCQYSVEEYKCGE